MSINLELPTADGLKKLAPGKSRSKILTPMRQIQRGITANKFELMEYKKDALLRACGTEYTDDCGRDAGK